MRFLWCVSLVASAGTAQSIDPARLIWQKDASRAEVEAQAARVHAAMDIDCDGYVTREELLKAANARVGHPPAAGDPHEPVPPMIVAMFDATDTNHDGRISVPESKAGADAEFARADTNRDGVVTPDERLAGARRFAEEHAAVLRPASAHAAMPPADMLQRLDDFRDHLSPAARDRLDRALPRSADGGVAACDIGEGSRASCEVAAYMPALRSAGLMPRFLASVRAR
jgi:hypothetical protein